MTRAASPRAPRTEAARIEALEKRNAELEKRIARLEQVSLSRSFRDFSAHVMRGMRRGAA